MSATDRVFYFGTPAGLFAVSNGNGTYAARSVGLRGKGQVRAVLVDRSDPKRIWAGTSLDGIWRTDDAGQTWKPCNEGLVYKSVWSIAQHPTTGELWAGTEPPGMFRSTDEGETWSFCEQLHTLQDTQFWTFPRPPHIAHVKNITLRADDPAWVYGAIEEGWVIRSKDSGKTWETCKQGLEFDMHQVTVMPDDPRIVVAASGQGCFRSENGGDSFRPASDGLVGRYLAPISLHPARPKILYAAAAEAPPPFWRGPRGANSSFYRSEDQARSWSRLTGGLPETLTAAPRSTAVDPDAPEVVAVGCSDGPMGPKQTGLIWLSEDGGESFRKIIDGTPPVTSMKIAHR